MHQFIKLSPLVSTSFVPAREISSLGGHVCELTPTVSVEIKQPPVSTDVSSIRGRIGERSLSCISTTTSRSSIQILIDPEPIDIDVAAPSASTTSIKPSYSTSKGSLLSLMSTEEGRYSLYVLLLLLICNSYNQTDKFVISTLSIGMQQDQHWGDGEGGGRDYELLIGTYVALTYLPASLIISFISDAFFACYRPQLLSVLLLVESACCIFEAFSQDYFQVAAGLMVSSMAQSAVVSLAGAILADQFSGPERGHLKTTVQGVLNWGTYVGQSMSIGVASTVMDLWGWQMVWLLLGVSGMLWVPLIWNIKVTSCEVHVRAETTKKYGSMDSIDATMDAIGAIGAGDCMEAEGGEGAEGARDGVREDAEGLQSVRDVFYCVKYFLEIKSIWLLFAGAMVRFGGWYVWQFNYKYFFTAVRGESDVEEATYLVWMPVLGGTIGAFVGGVLCDRFVTNGQRVGLLSLSIAFAAPFCVLTLVLEPPVSYFMLLVSNIVGEMWVGIVISLVVELSPKSMKTTALSLYFFVIGFAMFIPNLLTLLQTVVNNYILSLIVLYPGFYILSAIIFAMLIFTFDKDIKKVAHV